MPLQDASSARMCGRACACRQQAVRHESASSVGKQWERFGLGARERKSVWSAPRKVSVARLACVMSTRRRIELEVVLTASLALCPGTG